MARISPAPRFIYFAAGDIIPGGKVHTYVDGTTTPKTTYTDSTATSSNTNPVILNSQGYADIWLDDGAYTFVITDASDVTLATINGIVGDAQAAFGGSSEAISTNTTAQVDDREKIFIASATLTLTLPESTTAGAGWYIGVANPSASGTVTLAPSGSDVVTGQTTVPPGYSAFVYCDGVTFYPLFLNNILALNSTFTGNNTFTGDTTFTGDVRTPDDGELTISGGSITVTGAKHSVDTESDAASDDLDTINGGASGQILFLTANNTARTVVIKHNVGNIVTPSGLDIALDDTNISVLLQYDNASSQWKVIGAPAPTSVLSESYVSTEQTLTFGGTLTLAHSLSGIPKVIYASIICKTSEGGYAVGEELGVSLDNNFGGSSAASAGMTVAGGASNIHVSFTPNSGYGMFPAFNKNTNIVFTATPANWRLIIRAFF